MSHQIKGRVSTELFELLRDAFHERRITQQDAVVEAMTMWVGREPVQRPDSGLKPDHKKVVDEVILYLRNATPSEIHLLRTMLAMKNKASGASEAKSRKDASY